MICPQLIGWAEGLMPMISFQNLKSEIRRGGGIERIEALPLEGRGSDGTEWAGLNFNWPKIFYSACPDTPIEFRLFCS